MHAAAGTVSARETPLLTVACNIVAGSIVAGCSSALAFAGTARMSCMIDLSRGTAGGTQVAVRWQSGGSLVFGCCVVARRMCVDGSVGVQWESQMFK